MASEALPLKYSAPMTAATKAAPLPPTAIQPASGVFIVKTSTTPAMAATAATSRIQPQIGETPLFRCRCRPADLEPEPVKLIVLLTVLPLETTPGA